MPEYAYRPSQQEVAQEVARRAAKRKRAEDRKQARRDAMFAAHRKAKGWPA